MAHMLAEHLRERGSRDAYARAGWGVLEHTLLDFFEGNFSGPRFRVARFDKHTTFVGPDGKHTAADFAFVRAHLDPQLASFFPVPETTCDLRRRRGGGGDGRGGGIGPCSQRRFAAASTWIFYSNNPNNPSEQ